jgi:hypothetical protein
MGDDGEGYAWWHYQGDPYDPRNPADEIDDEEDED